MKYHVTGAHKETADDIELLVEAANEDAAAKTVSGMNLMVERVEPATEPLPNDAVRYEYHTLRCDFRDLQSHINKYAADYWRAYNIHHDPSDDKMVRVVLERVHRMTPDAQY
ncbi:MAG: hypothetical protein H6817_07290 [Phycisphaerales bacterium]|nr:hypothetical protein [Phycisphaerales bacterium]